MAELEVARLPRRPLSCDLSAPAPWRPLLSTLFCSGCSNRGAANQVAQTTDISLQQFWRLDVQESVPSEASLLGS